MELNSTQVTWTTKPRLVSGFSYYILVPKFYIQQKLINPTGTYLVTLTEINIPKEANNGNTGQSNTQ